MRSSIYSFMPVKTKSVLNKLLVLTYARKAVTVVLVDFKRIVAYICPFCSNISSKSISIFHFSGTEKVELICPTHGCHETCVYITKKNSKYKLDIECPLCGETHNYTISKEHFWNKPLISYKCPIAGISVFFAGERHHVETALEESSDLYSDIMADFDDEEENDTLNMLYAIIEKLHMFKDNNKLSCICGNDDIELNVVGGNIVLTCSQCKRSKIVECSEQSLDKMQKAKSIMIGD